MYYEQNTWNADIIHTPGRGYRAIFSFPECPDYNSEYCRTWKELADAIRIATGVRIPRRKSFKFSRLSDWETIAGIDASHIRENGCIVTSEDRKNGWCRWTF